jgi:hypothetical protein
MAMQCEVGVVAYECETDRETDRLLPAQTPIMATDRMLSAYTYLTPEVTIIRPQGMREVSALRAFRTGRYRKPARGYNHDHERYHVNAQLYKGIQAMGNPEEHPSVEEKTQAMISRGFDRPEANWRAWKAKVYRDNQKVMLDWLSM